MSPAQRNSVHKEAEFRALMVRQHGLFTTAQWLARGRSPSALSRRAQRGDFVRVLPGVYRGSLVQPSLQQWALAGVLWGGPDALASHATALALWGGELVKPFRVHVLTPSSRSARADFVVVHRGVDARNERRLRDGVPLTSPARTLIDVAACLGPEDLEAAVEDLLHRGVTTPQSIERCLGVLGGRGRTGSEKLRRILDDRGCAALESKLEVKIWRLLRRARLRPVRQFDVRCGARTYRLDFAWPPLKVTVEGEGFDAHGTRAAFVGDRQRRADLAAHGWVVLPATWDDCVRDPDRLIERIRAALLRAA
jgi:very-short-patch-repair endonuclease